MRMVFSPAENGEKQQGSHFVPVHNHPVSVSGEGKRAYIEV